MAHMIQYLSERYPLLRQVVGITMAVVLTWAILEATWLIYYPAISIIAVFGVFTSASAYALISISRAQRKQEMLINKTRSNRKQ